MIEFIGAIDGIAGFVLVLAMLTHRMTILPKWHRIWIAVIACGLLGQAAIEFGGVDRVSIPLWALKDVGIWGLLVSYSLQMFKRS